MSTESGRQQALEEVACDLPHLFGRATSEGHEAGQRLAKQVQEKMRRALADPAMPKAAKEALEAYAKPQRWLRAYQPTGELGLTRCVFTSRGHGFELAQEALAELKEKGDG